VNSVMSAGITWQRTSDIRTWRAAADGLVLTVTKLSTGRWAATVAGPFTDERSPEFGTRTAAQRWAEGTAGVAE
jgi:hypothetical protein